jgi:acetyl esterase/lipase
VHNARVRGEWIAPRNPQAGVILYIHGGGYVAGSTRTHRPLTAALARLTQRRVFSVDYRLAPEHPFPAAYDDAVCAYQWMLDETAHDSSSIAIAGDSAGGGLTLALLVAAREREMPMPACAVLYSPWTDMEGLIEAPHPNVGRCAMFAPPNIDDFANAYLGNASRRDTRASPLLSEMHGLPPLLLQVGEPELLVEDSRRVHEKIRSAGGSSDLEIWPNVFHGWQMLDGLVPEARAALHQSATFIGRHLETSRSTAGETVRRAANYSRSTLSQPEKEDK